MEHTRSLEANKSSGIRGIPRMLLNPKIHYRIQNGPHHPILKYFLGLYVLELRIC